jgi:hypothetical protein
VGEYGWRPSLWSTIPKFLKRRPPQNNIFVVNVLDKNMVMKKAFDI